MTSIKRVDALLKAKSVDRVPFFPIIQGFCAKNVGYPVSSIYNDPDRSFQAQLWTQQQYGYDSDPFFAYASYRGWESGEDAKFEGNEWEQAPPHGKPPVQYEEDIENLCLPDVKTAGLFPQAMRFSKLQKKFGMTATVVLGGAFTIAGNICPLENLLHYMIRQPELMHRLLRLATNHIVDVVRHWVDTFGAESVIVYMWETLANNRIISPRQFKDFVLPYQREIHLFILATGIKHILCHICGDHNLNLPYWAQIPMGDPGIVSVGHEVDLDAAVKYFGTTSIVAGNIDPAIIQNGTPQQVYELCKQTIKKGKHAPRGYIMMSGCEVPVATPPYNLYEMVKAIDDFG